MKRDSYCDVVEKVAANSSGESQLSEPWGCSLRPCYPCQIHSIRRLLVYGSHQTSNTFYSYQMAPPSAFICVRVLVTPSSPLMEKFVPC